MSSVGSFQIAWYIAADPVNKILVLAIRGTSANPLDYFTDVSYALTTYPGCAGCMVHTGFLGLYNNGKTRIRAGIQAAVAAYPTYQIVVTGHSLGGDVGVIAAADLRSIGYKLDMVRPTN
jgi:hypothetical protein